MTAPLTRETLANIRKNAGRVPPIRIAESLGWTLPQLERVAHQRQIDLKLEPVHPDDAPEPPRQYDRRIAFSLGGRDLGRIEELAARYYLPRAGIVRRVIENARARGLLDELARLPAPATEPHEEVLDAP